MYMHLNTDMFYVHVLHKGPGVCEQEIYYQGLGVNLLQRTGCVWTRRNLLPRTGCVWTRRNLLPREPSSESILMGVCATSANTQTVRTRRLHDCQYTRVDCILDIDVLPHLALFLVTIYMISQWSTSSWSRQAWMLCKVIHCTCRMCFS